MGNKKKIPGYEQFERYYQEEFGDRWLSLRDSMTHQKTFISLGSKNPGEVYYLDKASVVCVLSLDVQPHHTVLDLCAAPGGKSLVILRKLFPDWFNPGEIENIESIQAEITNSGTIRNTNGNRGSLIANERSATRRARLKKNLHDHSQDMKNISITSHDASRWGMYQANSFDRVLADVPCSSERHLIENPKYLDDWSPSRTKHLAIQAGAIVLSGFDTMKPGGRMVYSTCALSKKENQEILEKILTKRNTAKILPIQIQPPWLENAGLGYTILPDSSNGMGPIFFGIITKEE